MQKKKAGAVPVREMCSLYMQGTSVTDLANTFDRSVHTIKGMIRNHLHQGKYRTLAEVRRPLSVTQPDERWVRLRLPTKTTYLISSYGRLLNTHNDKLVNFRVVFGYFSFEYTDQTLQKRRAQLVHVLVAQHFGRYKPGLNVIHADHDTFNNHYRNLRSVTPEQRVEHAHASPNAQQAVARGKLIGVTQGNNTPNRKLTRVDVVAIKTSKKTVFQLAQLFNVSNMQVQRIQRGDSWRSVLPSKSREQQPTPSTPLATVRRIKRLLASGKKNGRQIAEKVGVTPTTVSRIRRGKTYAAVV